MNGPNGSVGVLAQAASARAILVVDDEPQVLNAIEDELADQYRVLLETSPRSAIKRLENEKDLTVVISDQRMPGMNGHEFLAKAMEISDATRILITGYSDIEAVISAVNRGRIFGYISKPWSADHLRLLVMKASEHFTLLQELSEEKTLLHNLMDNVPDAIFFKDREHRFLRVNKVTAGLLGLSNPKDAVGKSLDAFVSAERVAEIQAEERRIIETGETVADRVHRIEDASGRAAWFSVTRAPIRDEKGQISSIVGIRRDITERMATEEALHDAQERGRLIVEGALDACVAIGADGLIIDWNKQAEITFGWSRAEALGRDVAETIVPPRHREAHVRGTKEFVATAAGRILNRRVELSGLHKDGREFPIEIAVGSIRRKDGYFFNAFIRDISRRKEQEERIARLTRLYAVLSGINALIVRVRDRQQLFEEACHIAVEDGQFAAAWVGLYDPDAKSITPVASHGPIKALLDDRVFSLSESQAPEGMGTLGLAIRDKKLTVCNDIAASPKTGIVRSGVVALGYGSVVSLPLVVNEAVAAVLILYAQRADFFDEAEMRLLREMAGDISFALEHIAKEERLNYLALYDVLTGLPNRTLFSDRLAQQVQAAKQSGMDVALLLVDVARFRHLNDAMGRDAGDVLLKLVAERLALAAVVKEGVSRVGADLFALALPSVKGVAEVARFAEEHLLPQLLQAYEIQGEEVRVSVKLGIALFPHDGNDAEVLFANAETALEKAKLSGERYVFYAAEMNAKVADALRLETKLRRALEAQQFVLHYQPKVEIKNNRITGLEALIRWNDPESGLVRPGEFIPVLEETGLILEVGKWAIERVVADYGRWIEQGFLPPRIAVNASPIQLRRDDFVDTVARALAANPSVADFLDLEITESVIMHDVESHIPKLRALRDKGIKIAIDDFGTGYSSLAYIAKLPVNELKIDRAFIVGMTTNPDDMTIVSTIISLAHALELTVIAEGVETDEQAKLLRLVKCDQMQGYFFSKPRPLDEIEVMLARKRA